VCYMNERQHTPSSAGVMSRVVITLFYFMEPRVCYLNERQHTPSSAGVMSRVGQNHMYTMYLQCIYTVFLTGKSPNVRSYAVYIYGSGQPY